MSTRRESRILAMQALCQFEAHGDAFMDDLDAFLRDESPPEEVFTYARSLAAEGWKEHDAIDARIEAISEHWSVKRMAIVDRNILRMAVCELQQHTDVPPKVVINEAVEIAKAFGAAESGGFINGILDAIAIKDPNSMDEQPTPLAQEP
jgi:N utilization substance protein B